MLNRTVARWVLEATRNVLRVLFVLSFVLAGKTTVVLGGTTTVVHDTWSDGGLTDGQDEGDVDWLTSSSRKGIEVKPGSMGLVSGTSGRGIHTVFPTKELGVGDKLTVRFAFKTPKTVAAESKPSSFRIGLFDNLGREELTGHVACSSTTPHESLKGLPGYMMDLDVATGSEDLNIREHDVTSEPSVSTGRLLGSLSGFNSLGTGDDGVYQFQPNTKYQGSLAVKRISETRVRVTASIGEETFSTTDRFDSTRFGLLAFYVNSNVFGSTNAQDVEDNGIDFTEVVVELESAAFAQTSPE